MTRQKKYWTVLVVLAFASIISFFQINSYWSDKNNFNGLIGWLGIGIVLGLGAIYCYTQVRNPPGTDKH